MLEPNIDSRIWTRTTYLTGMTSQLTYNMCWLFPNDCQTTWRKLASIKLSLPHTPCDNSHPSSFQPQHVNRRIVPMLNLEQLQSAHLEHKNLYRSAVWCLYLYEP